MQALIVLLIVIGLNAFSETAFAQSEAAVLDATSDAKLRVMDDSGFKLILSSEAKRIVALAPHIVENLFTIGAGERVVGAVSYSDFPEAAKKIERVGVASGISIEKIISLKPDLVVTWHTGRSTKLTKRLRSLGIPVYANDPRRLPDIGKSLRDFGILTGNVSQAEAAAKSFELQISALRAQFENQKKVPVFYQVWHKPLQTLGGEHIISDIIQLCGGRNIFQHASSIAPKVSIEAVIVKNPEIIVMSGSEASTADETLWWQKFPMINAVKKRSFGFIEPDHISRHSVRLTEGARAMCELLVMARNT